MRSRHALIATLLAGTAAGPAVAHPGHLTELAGHNHWIAGAAIAVAVLISAWAVVQGSRQTRAEAEADTDAADPQDQEG
jgi:hypothetical protein